MTPAPPALGLMAYAGLVLGVAFVATPAKFLAPHLTLPVALEVGRYTFRVFNRMEWGVLVALGLWGWVQAPGRQWWATLATAGLIVLLESVWLLPALDRRAQVIIDGGTPTPSSLHLIYIMLEATKIVVLLSAAFSISVPRAEAFVEGATSIL